MGLGEVYHEWPHANALLPQKQKYNSLRINRFAEALADAAGGRSVTFEREEACAGG